MVDVICKRAELGYNYGVILIPEGLIDFIPEVLSVFSWPIVIMVSSSWYLSAFTCFQVQQLIAELNEILAHDVVDEDGIWKKKLTNQSLKLFEFLPQAIQEQLMLERDPHGNVQVLRCSSTDLCLLKYYLLGFQRLFGLFFVTVRSLKSKRRKCWFKWLKQNWRRGSKKDLIRAILKDNHTFLGT